jgi:hypothetical protein
VSTKHDHLRALGRVCRQLGGRLAIISQRAFDDLFYHRDRKGWEGLTDAPFTSAHGIHWRKKIIYAVRGREEVGSIIHEMGHVFAAQHHPECYCGKCHEWNWFGWEVTVARRIGASRTWSRHNARYQTGGGGGGRWETLTARKRRAVVADRLARAMKIGVLDQSGAPRSIR